MGSDTKTAVTYPTEGQYEQWKDHADDLGMSTSEFIQSMVEAGRKKFDASVEPDESLRDLREQRNDLRDELDHARTRIESLEERVHHGERATIRRYVEENPGAAYDEIIQHVLDSAPERVTTHLEDLEGEDLRLEDGTYYPIDSDSRSGSEGSR